MSLRTKDIKINVTWEGVIYEFETYHQEYRSLMALIQDKINIPDFGACKGIGRCGTCHVQILDGNKELFIYAGNEHTTLNRMSGVETGSRLSCQLLINDQIHGLHVVVRNDEDPGLW